MAKFRVLHGKHTEGGHYVEDKDGNKVRVPGKTYVKGDIVDSESDLSLMNSTGAIKFELVSETGQAVRNIVPQQHSPVPVQPQPQPQPTTAQHKTEDLDSLSVADLRKVAEDEEVDLTGATKKEDVIKAIRSSRVSASSARGYRS